MNVSSYIRDYNAIKYELDWLIFFLSFFLHLMIIYTLLKDENKDDEVVP